MTHPRRWLAKPVCAVLEEGACTQPAQATALARLGLTTARNESQQVTIRRWLNDPRVTYATAYAPLVRQMLAPWSTRVLTLREGHPAQGSPGALSIRPGLSRPGSAAQLAGVCRPRAAGGHLLARPVPAVAG